MVMVSCNHESFSSARTATMVPLIKLSLVTSRASGNRKTHTTNRAQRPGSSVGTFRTLLRCPLQSLALDSRHARTAEAAKLHQIYIAWASRH